MGGRPAESGKPGPDDKAIRLALLHIDRARPFLDDGTRTGVSTGCYWLCAALAALGHPMAEIPDHAPPKESLDSRRLTVLAGRVEALEGQVRRLIDHLPLWPEAGAPAVAELDDIG